MTNTHQRFVPLHRNSQREDEAVFYYDREASLEALHSNITSRIKTVTTLLNGCPPSALHSVMVASSYLLNDVRSLLKEFEPNALKARAKSKVNASLEHKPLKLLTFIKNKPDETK